MKLHLIIWVNLIIGFSTIKCFSTTWKTAYPYTQQIDGQQIVIKAVPFAPGDASPMIGETKVYYKTKLLYTINQYFREKLYSSDDGRYLVLVHNSLSEDMLSGAFVNLRKTNYSRPAIDIYKDGKIFKPLTIEDVTNSAKLTYLKHELHLGYYLDANELEGAESRCKTCEEIYGKKVLRKIDTSEIDVDEWKECDKDCDLWRNREAKIKFSQNSVYVKNNSLYILTNENIILILNLKNLEIRKVAFRDLIPKPNQFSPPKLTRIFDQIEYPEEFLLPKLKGGNTLAEELAKFLDKKISYSKSDSAAIQFYFHTLVITIAGKCEQVYVSISPRDETSKDLREEQKHLLKTTVEEWIKIQDFETSTIPKDFSKFKYSDFIHLK